MMSTHIWMLVGRVIYKLRRTYMHYSAGEAESARPDNARLKNMGWYSMNGEKEESRGRINKCDIRLGGMGCDRNSCFRTIARSMYKRTELDLQF